MARRQKSAVATNDLCSILHLKVNSDINVYVIVICLWWRKKTTKIQRRKIESKKSEGKISLLRVCAERTHLEACERSQSSERSNTLQKMCLSQHAHVMRAFNCHLVQFFHGFCCCCCCRFECMRLCCVRNALFDSRNQREAKKNCVAKMDIQKVRNRNH